VRCGPAATVRRALFGLFLVLFTLECAKCVSPAALPANPQLLATLLLAEAAITLMASLTPQLPFQNVLLASAIIALVGTAGEAVGLLAGLWVGRDAGGQELSLWMLRPVLWILAVLTSRGVAQVILRPWRRIAAYGYGLLGTTAVLAGLSLASFEFVASGAGVDASRSAFDQRFGNFAIVGARAVIGVAALLLATPALVKTRPGQSSSNRCLIVLWSLFNLLYVTAACWPSRGHETIRSKQGLLASARK
jgi:hypothetical protein